MDLPKGATEYARTATFTESTVPSKLLNNHNLKAGSWGVLTVEEGALELVFGNDTRAVSAGEHTVIPPVDVHHVRLVGPVRFFVAFYR